MNTGLKLRGFEVWAYEPDKYLHYHTLHLRLPKEFPTNIREYEWLGRSYWKIAFDRPDGIEQVVYGTLRSREEAEMAYETYEGAKSGRIECEFKVGYKKTDENGEYLPYEFVTSIEPTAKPWGTTWADSKFDYPPLKFDLTPDEALIIIEWREGADKKWFENHPNFLEAEKRRVENEANFAASLGTPPYEG